MVFAKPVTRDQFIMGLIVSVKLVSMGTVIYVSYATSHVASVQGLKQISVEPVSTFLILCKMDIVLRVNHVRSEPI